MLVLFDPDECELEALSRLLGEQRVDGHPAVSYIMSVRLHDTHAVPN
jgi:hypothetical protein